MSISPNGSFKGYTYTGDDGNGYNIRLSQAVAAGGSFAAGSSANRRWGSRSGKNKVRGVYGTTADGLHTAFLPCPTTSAMMTKFNGGTFQIGSTVYKVTGRIGEQVSVERV